MTNEQEQFEQLLAKLMAEFGAENVSVMGKHSFPELTLIWEEKEYEPKWEESDEQSST